MAMTASVSICSVLLVSGIVFPICDAEAAPLWEARLEMI